MDILGMWMWPYSIRRYGAERIMAYCSRARVTDVYFLAKGLEGETAFHGPYAPCICERDLLQELLDAAHKAGIRVHAWFTSACDDHYRRTHPESGRCHLFRGRDRELISLEDEGYMACLEQIIRDVCRRYDIDGLHLDYIRYNHMLYGWGEAERKRYAQAGADVARLEAMMKAAYQGRVRDEEGLLQAYRQGDCDLHAFARVRREDVYRFASRMCNAARQEKPGILLSAALMPEGAYPDGAFAALHYGQSYEDAAVLYDHVLPMAYSNAYGKDGGWVRQVAAWTLGFGLKTVMGLHAYEEGTGETLWADMQAIQGMPVAGVCLFRMGACALAYAGKDGLTLYNGLEKQLTRVLAVSEGQTWRADVLLPAGEEAVLRVPFTPCFVRAFAGEEEVSVHLTQE